MAIDDRELKEAALAGLRHERQRMDELIARLQRELGPRGGRTKAEPGRAPRKRQMSAEGRRRIALATKQRWAAYREAKAKRAARTKSAGPMPEEAAS